MLIFYKVWITKLNWIELKKKAVPNESRTNREQWGQHYQLVKNEHKVLTISFKFLSGFHRVGKEAFLVW